MKPINNIKYRIMIKSKVKILLLMILAVNQTNTKEVQKTKELFQKINDEYVKLNSIGAKITWESSLNPHNPVLPAATEEYLQESLTWQHSNCANLKALIEHNLLNFTQRRQTYLLCRGPVHTYQEARISSDLLEKLSNTYSEKYICIPTADTEDIDKSTKVKFRIEAAILSYLSTVKKYLKTGPILNEKDINIAAKASIKIEANKNDTMCMGIDSHLKNMMSFSRNVDALKFVWLAWREAVGPDIKQIYLKLIHIENNAARRNEYQDLGAVWRDELEYPNLRKQCRKLYQEVKPFYVLLHGVLRHFLRKFYGNIVPEKGLIPAHLLGDMWSQNWGSLADIIHPNVLNLDDKIEEFNWSVLHMIKRAEDFYQSLGFPAMTEKFWKYSVFNNINNKDNIRCHGSAADMFEKGDFRLLYCSETTMEDLYVIHHELGHIQYYMSYEHQPGIFRQGNSALHESIGDAIMYGVLTPQHLNRLGLINDSYLYTNNFNDNYHYKDNKIDNEDIKATQDELFLLKTALSKIPQIPFSLLMDEYRWRLFEEDIKEEELNEEFWKLAKELQGIGPPDNIKRDEKYFDVAAVFHVPDNTPYIRYYLSSFLQLQIFEALCKVSIFGQHHMENQLPNSLPLARCDIYGSKAAGKLLKEMMSKGNSENLQQILRSSFRVTNISSSSLKRYYLPLKKYLRRLVTKYNIPLGWQ